MDQKGLDLRKSNGHFPLVDPSFFVRTHGALYSRLIVICCCCRCRRWRWWCRFRCTISPLAHLIIYIFVAATYCVRLYECVFVCERECMRSHFFCVSASVCVCAWRASYFLFHSSYFCALSKDKWWSLLCISLFLVNVCVLVCVHVCLCVAVAVAVTVVVTVSRQSTSCWHKHS